MGNELISIKSFVTELKKDIVDSKQQLRNDVTELRSQMVEDFNSKMQLLRSELKAELEKKQDAGATVNEMAGKTKPPVFDGSVSWSVYRLQFEAAAKVNRWNTKAEKATGLVLALRGKAAKLLQTMKDQTDFDAMVKTMELRYGDEHLQEVFRIQLKSRQQKSGETLQELAADIERLARLAYPLATPEFVDVIVTDAFIDGVRDAELKKAIRISGKRKVSEALIYALSYEAARDSAKATYYSRTIDSREEDATQLVRRLVGEAIDERRPQEEDLARLVRRVVEETRDERRPYIRHNKTPFRCWNCNTPGHMQRDCTRVFRGRERQTQGRQNGNREN
ncbi:uncharacterized protein LOC129928518 [Biomphalaria glabrata]|uniref:Uncharacterized protein LOC129928518 n=1 Tax=Biomphalaria glabrata TaxID=6526 RepID=A0A9W3BI57_BIOGL|nr:uncharacterized protein LOC129928518 [Biomphalaria glabrata]